MSGLGGSPLSSATPNYTLPPKNRQADYPPATYRPYMVNFKLHLYFSRWAGVVVIKLKANLSSTGTGLANCNGAWQQTDIVISKFKKKLT